MMTDSVRPYVPAAVDWQTAMKRAIRDADELCQALDLPHRYAAAARAAAEEFGLFVPLEFAARIVPGDAGDPLLRQVLPVREELSEEPGFTRDAVGDLPAVRAAGLLQKYRGRALLIVSGACPVHCRYCFRRHFPYSEGPRGFREFEPALTAIGRDDSIEEVIFSGGDPLTLVDEKLAELAQAIAAIGHVRRLRVHTRMPIMIPQRVTPALIELLTNTRLTPIVVLHANHPHEMDSAVERSLAKLADAGVMLLNQAVLLAGVNDDAGVLTDLSRRLLECRVLPYYLHQLDRVAGAAHFEVDEQTGRRLIQHMRQELPGYAVPRYVREAAGEMWKQIIE